MPRLLLAVLWALAVAAPDASAQGRLERAREELGIERPLPARWPLPNGDLEVGPAELLASAAGASVRFTVRLERPEPGGALYVRLPGTGRGRSGLRAVRGPQRLEIRFGEGLEHSASVEHVGLAAGTYALPLTWHDGRRAGTARLRVLAADREPDPVGPWRGMDVSADAEDQSEAFSAVAPGDPDRIVTAANPGQSDPTLPAWLSNDGGRSWSRHPLPEALDVPGTATPEPAAVCCDPMLAATAAGDLWVGAISEPEGPPGARSRIVVNRLPASGREGFAPLSVGLPVRTGGLQDKPMMTAAPDGRLLVVWLEPSASSPGALHVVLSGCQTALGPEEDPGAWCENADHWTAPVPVTPTPGSYTYPDVAAAADGTVHVTWWDYSAMENGVRGATCAAPCLGSFGAPRTIALLDAMGGRPLPFGCPILVAPGGRAGAAPSVEAAPDGRVWVAWADLRAGSGSTRCEETASGGYTAPRASHLSWDAFAATASGALPGGASPSATVGAPLLVDGDEGVAGSSDDFLPWLAVDPTYGEAWAAAYSTGHDPQRRSAHYVVVSLSPGEGGRPRTGPANRVSVAPSDFAGAPCCDFGNDFGDYAGLAVTDRVVVPAWIDNATGGDADLWAAAGPLATVGFDLVALTAEEGDGDGDGTIEPQETVLLRTVVLNTGTRTANGFARAGPAGTLTGEGVVAGSASWSALAPGASAAGEPPFEMAVGACDRPLTARLAMESSDGSETLPVSLQLGCGPPGPEPTPQPTPSPSPRPGPPSLTVPAGQRLRTVLRRGLLVAARCPEGCRTALTADLFRTTAQRLRLRRRIATATATLGPRTRRVRLPVRARARRLLGDRSSVALRVRMIVAGVPYTRHVVIRR